MLLILTVVLLLYYKLQLINFLQSFFFIVKSTNIIINKINNKINICLYSTVTTLAKFFGLSGLIPRNTDNS